MLTEREIKGLLILLERRKALILLPTETEAQSFRKYLRTRIKNRYPAFYNGYETTGTAVHIKGCESVTVTTPENWRNHNKPEFGGIVLVEDSMSPDEYAPIPYVKYSPEKLHEYLEAIIRRYSYVLNAASEGCMNI